MQERRKSTRLRRVFLPASVTANGLTLVAVIRDLSENGLGIQCNETLEPGTAVSVQWGSNSAMPGVVGWADGDRMGILTESSPIAHDDGEQPRASRFEVRLPIEVLSNGRACMGSLLNLSTKGMSIATQMILRKGELISVSVGSLTFAECTVKWTKDGLVGLALKYPVRLDVVREVVARSQSVLNIEPGMAANEGDEREARVALGSKG